MRARWWLVGVAFAGLIVLLLAPLASSEPDGLERVAADRGFLEAARGAFYELLPDYTVPGVDDATASTIAAGLIGVVVIFVLTWGLGIVLTRGRRQADQEPS